MANTEEERVKRIMDDVVDQYTWDPVDKTIRPPGTKDPTRPALDVTDTDLGHATDRRRAKR